MSVLLLALASPGIVHAAQTLQGHVPAAAKAARMLGRLGPDVRLQLSIGLPLRNREALTNLVEELYNPASPDFRKFLTVEQFTERFGPSATDYAGVVEFAKQHGLNISGTHPNRVVLDVNGTVGQIEKAFHIRLNRYQHPREPREFYAPDTEPTLDLAVPVLDISGLDDFVIPHPAHLVVGRHPPVQDRRPLAGSGPNGSYTGFDFRAAYAPNVLLNGSGQYVGLLQFDGYYASDIAAYVSRVAGLTNVALTNILLNGFSGNPGTNNVEVALDVEMAISMAPGLSAVLVYEGTTANTILSRMATDNVAKQLSASWSFPVNNTSSSIFLQFAAQGQSYFNASGDDGAFVGPAPPPADNPYITVVGGTTLSTRGPGLGWLSETAWNWYSTGSGTSGTGGGVSTTYNIPSWQRPVDMSFNGGSPSRRNVPDVALISDHVFAITDNGQESFMGGTSIGAPLWAGYLALVNQQGALFGQPTIGFLNPAVYPIGLGTNYASAFHDIRTGNNTNPASPGAFYAVAGFDLCTGWGTPGTNLINILAPPPAYPLLVSASPVLVTETCSPANGAVDPGEAVVMSFPIQNYGSVATTNLVATLLGTNGVVPASNPQTYGALAQGAKVSRQFAFVPIGDCGSIVNPVLQLQDGPTDFGTITYSVLLGPPGGGCCTPATNADLAVSQSIYPSQPSVGQTVAYTITVRSLGPGPAVGVRLADTLPAGATFVFASAGYTNSGGILAWDLGLMPLGRVTNLTVLVTPVSGGQMTNVAVLAAVSADAIVTNNSSIAVVAVSAPPVIISQPVDQVAVAGGDVTFQVGATGTGPLSYQWLFQGSIMQGKTDATLVLTNIQELHAGAYSVVVSNLVGTTNSLAAVLKVLVPPAISLSGIGVSSTNVTVSLASLAGVSYLLEYKDALTDSVWSPLGTAVAGTGGLISLQDTNAVLPPVRFYRVNCQP